MVEGSRERGLSQLPRFSHTTLGTSLPFSGQILSHVKSGNGVKHPLRSL